MSMEKIVEFNKDVRNIQPLGDTPIISGEELRMAFDKAGVDIKEYLNDTLVCYINDELTVGVDKNGEDIANLDKKIEENKNDVNKEAVKIYVNSTNTEPVNTSPEIRFVKNTAPSMNNYGAKLPVGSVVFVYEG